MAFQSPFDNIIDDLGTTFRPQRQWAQGRGLLLISAHFISGVGAGAWLLAAILGFRPGLFGGLAIVLVGGLFHLAFLGRPDRFWRMMSRMQSSWISRGLWGMGVFTVFAVIYLILSAAPGVNISIEGAFYGLSLLGAVWIMLYKGFVWASARGIPFWNSTLLPVVFFVYAVRGGVATLFVSLLFVSQTAENGVVGLELVKLWLAVSSGALVILYLTVMPSSGLAAGRSVAELVGGRVSLSFYLGVVLFGLVIPIAIGAYGYSTVLAVPLLAVVGVSSLIGDYYTIYSIARAGIYRPLLSQVVGRTAR